MPSLIVLDKGVYRVSRVLTLNEMISKKFSGINLKDFFCFQDKTFNPKELLPGPAYNLGSKRFKEQTKIIDQYQRFAEYDIIRTFLEKLIKESLSIAKSEGAEHASLNLVIQYKKLPKKIVFENIEFVLRPTAQLYFPT